MEAHDIIGGYQSFRGTSSFHLYSRAYMQYFLPTHYSHLWGCTVGSSCSNQSLLPRDYLMSITIKYTYNKYYACKVWLVMISGDFSAEDVKSTGWMFDEDSFWCSRETGACVGGSAVIRSFSIRTLCWGPLMYLHFSTFITICTRLLIKPAKECCYWWLSNANVNPVSETEKISEMSLHPHPHSALIPKQDLY